MDVRMDAELHLPGIEPQSQDTPTVGAIVEPHSEVSISVLQDILDYIPDDHPDRADFLWLLGSKLYDQSLRTHSLSDIEASVQLFEDSVAVQLCDGVLMRDVRLHSLGLGLMQKYQKTGNLADLEAAIERYEEALRILTDDYPQRARLLHDLGSAHYYKAQRTGRMADIENTIRTFTEASDIATNDDDKKACYLHDLGISIFLKFKQTGTVADLTACIQRYEDALLITPPCGSFPRAHRLQSLGGGLLYLYRRIGEIEDLEAAIQLTNEAIHIIPDDHRNRASYLHNLGTALVERYEKIGTSADLKLAIQRFEEAIGNSSDNDPDRAHMYETLGQAYRQSYIRSEEMTHLMAAIHSYERALDIMSEDDPNRPGCLENFAIGIHDRWVKTEEPADLETSIECYEKALHALPDSHPRRAGLLQHLGLSLRGKYLQTGSPSDLEDAIRHFEGGLVVMPQDHPERARRLFFLGASYLDRYIRTRSTEDFEAVVHQFAESLNHVLSNPFDRLQAGRRLLTLWANAQNWRLAYETACKIASLLPMVTSRSQENSDKQHLANEIVGFAADATAVALMAKESPYNALQLAEVGRGLVAGPLNEMRTDITELQSQYPDLATEFEMLRDQLDSPKETAQADARYNAARRFDTLLEEIRRRPKFDRFLQSPTDEQIRFAASDGPIVVVNVSEYSCDAIIITESSFKALQLTQLYYSDVLFRAETLRNPACLGTDLLEWLWDTIASPVLQALGFSTVPTCDWPRIWWIPAGILAKFPLHAAGYHSNGSPHTVLDRVVSSYSTSIKTLIHSRRNRRKVSSSDSLSTSDTIVLVGMEQTPGHITLPFVSQEIKQLEALGNSVHWRVIKPQACEQDVLAAVRNCSMFHFAGHGISHPEDASKSALILSDTWLTVASLFEVNLSSGKPFLAYLSACGTGQVKHDNLVDEGLHLIGACQLAGFQHVVGTLWEVNDESCVQVTMMTYKWIQEHDMRDEAVSEGLHHACRKLRGQWTLANPRSAPAAPGRGRHSQQLFDESGQSAGTTGQVRDADAADDAPLYWVPYVHFGT